jgi:hypothetical protein
VVTGENPDTGTGNPDLASSGYDAWYSPWSGFALFAFPLSCQSSYWSPRPEYNWSLPELAFSGMHLDSSWVHCWIAG